MKRNVYIQPHHSKGERERIESEALRHESTKKLAEKLKPHLIDIMEHVFRRYCRAHKATKAQEELEWERFKKILNRTL